MKLDGWGLEMAEALKEGLWMNQDRLLLMHTQTAGCGIASAKTKQAFDISSTRLARLLV